MGHGYVRRWWAVLHSGLAGLGSVPPHAVLVLGLLFVYFSEGIIMSKGD